MVLGLEGIRAISFLVVFGFHAGYISIGWVGVQLFFVLSGFLITKTLLIMKLNLNMGEYLFKFLFRRLLRILPLYYFFLAFILVMSSFLISIRYKTAIMGEVQEILPSTFLFIYNFSAALRDASPSHFLIHLWSLCVEFQFYFLWPFLIYLTPDKHLKKVFLAGIVLGPIIRFIFHLLQANGLLSVFQSPSSLALYTLPFSHIDAFAFGAYVSRFEIDKAKNKLFLTGLITIFSGFLSQYMTFGSIGNISALGYRVTLPNAYQFIWAYSLINCFFALMIYCVANHGLWTGFLELAPVRYIGKISYGLYIYHLPMIWFVKQLGMFRSFEKMSHIQVTFLAFTITVLLSAFSFHFFEKPMMRLKDRVASYSKQHKSSGSPQLSL
jgi:peptidoglycan/LPS O-acetylase OafA/YrhL